MAKSQAFSKVSASKESVEKIIRNLTDDRSETNVTPVPLDGDMEDIIVSKIDNPECETPKIESFTPPAALIPADTRSELEKKIDIFKGEIKK